MSVPFKPFDHEVNVPILTDFCMRFYVRDGGEMYDARIFPPHVDDMIEFYILLEGDVSFMVEHNLYKLLPGDIVITKPNEMHNCILNSDSRHRHMCFGLTRRTISFFPTFWHTNSEKIMSAPPRPRTREKSRISATSFAPFRRRERTEQRRFIWGFSFCTTSEEILEHTARILSFPI
ncbi:MAG: AraC family ligand binding domain-containing protein, partial [Clostridia bacterium]|nr:AraC family ligand binding domain-containing protein [Clostridia bacterium]